MTDDAERPSKTRRKKDMHALQALGETLVELSSAQLAEVEMPDDLRDAVLEARRINGHEGRRRQLQYIGRLMRDVDPAPIRAKLDEWRGQSREATAHMHAIERWRDRLIENDAALTDFANEHPGADLQALRAMIRETRRERAAERPPKHFRELYRLLRDAMQAKPVA
jgi:ribosome-associated protein